MAGIAHIEVRWVGVHALHLSPNGVGIVAQINAVAKTFAHFLFAVGAGEASCRGIFGQHNFRFGKHLAIGLVESARQFARQLNHGLLVFAHGNGGGVEGKDVGCL